MAENDNQNSNEQDDQSKENAASGRKRQWASEAKQDRLLSSYASEQIRETVYRETGRSTFIIQSL